MKPIWDLRCGDCLDPVTGLASLGDKSVDHVITDPPYSRAVYMRARAPESHGGRDGKAGSNTPNRIGPGLAALAAGAIGFVDEMIAPASEQFGRLCTRWTIVFSDFESADRWRLAMQPALRYMRTGAWVKPDAMPQMTGDRPAVGFEPCTIMHSALKSRWNGGGKQALWTFGVEKQDRPDHPCPKPIALMEKLIRDFTDPGDLILDPFAGSGTTGVAAIRLGRRFIGWEKDPKYHAIALKRLTAAKEQLELCA